MARLLHILVLLLALGCGAPPQPAPPAAEAPPAPASPAAAAAPPASPTPPPVLERSTLVSRGKTPWKLEAERVEYDDARRTARVGKLTWSLLDEEGNIRVRVEGNGALVDVEAEKVTFEGPVVAHGAKGEVLDVEHLVWDGEKTTFFGSEGVRIVRQATIVTGRTMEASEDLQRVAVEGDVRVTLREVGP